MKHILKFAAALMMVFATTAFAEPAERGYSMLNPPQPTNSGDKIEVLEFFFYGCIHCYHLHPALSKWEKTMPKDVQLTFVPTAFNPSWEPMAYTFYALEAMNQQKRLHGKLYDAWNVDRMLLIESDKIADFVATQGVDRQQFLANYNSFSVMRDVKRAKQMIRSYQIDGTPTLVVDGKYVINNLEPEDTIRVLDEVVNKVRMERRKH